MVNFVLKTLVILLTQEHNSAKQERANTDCVLDLFNKVNSADH